MNHFGRSLEVLHDAGVDFVVIGGVALAALGSAHLTYDLDICYERSLTNIERLVEALRPHNPQLRGAPEGLPFHFDAATVARGLNFTLTTELGDLDLFGEVAGLGTYQAVRAFSSTIALFGRPYNVLSLEGLIRAKRAAGRAKDLLVFPELEALRELEPHLKRESTQGSKQEAGASASEDDSEC